MSAGAPVLKLALGELELDLNDVDATGFLIAAVDLGSASPRSVMTDLPGQDGSFDQTAYFGPRTIQLTGAIVPTADGRSRTKAKDKLAPFIAAGARPTLFYALDGDVDIRCLTLRVGQWTNPVDHPQNASQFSVQWVCPDPISYGKSTNEVDLGFSAGSMDGFTFPLTFPLVFSGGGGGVGDSIVLNVGTYPSWPVLRIFGPCTDPSVIWVDPTSGEPIGTQVAFRGLSVLAGEYVEVDTKAKTAFANGDPGATRYNFVDFAATSWGQLVVGPNRLRFTAVAGSPDCICAVLWRESFLD